MSRPRNDPDFDNTPRISAELADDLRALFEPAGAKVPPELNQRILNDAQAQLARTGRSGRTRRLVLRWAGAAAAAAAVLLLVVRLPIFAPPPDALHAASVVGDVNRDGRIDILDALALARSIERNGSPAHDITGDGSVDQRDVDAVAMLAVRLDRGGVQ